MAEFTVDLQNLKHSLPRMFSNTGLLNHLSSEENFNPNVHGIMASSNETFLDYHRPMIPMTYTDISTVQASRIHHDGLFCDPLAHFLPPPGGPSHEISSKLKAIPQGESLVNSSFPISGTYLRGDNETNGNYSNGGKKRKRNNEREAEKPKEVVHVRARRGQATDSHSLAERLRREKINEKLRSLQDLVPGCYKTMGMSVMLDVIINYVRSLQNQIEFLSMKLSAASLFYDFNSSEMEAMETMQGTNGYEAQVMEKMVGEGHGGFPYFQPI